MPIGNNLESAVTVFLWFYFFKKLLLFWILWKHPWFQNICYSEFFIIAVYISVKCWTFRGFHLWTVVSFMEDPDRRARIENLAAFRERLQQNCNSLPSTQRQIAKNVSSMRTDLGLGGRKHSNSSSSSSSDGGYDANRVNGDTNDNTYLMVFKLTKSALVMNPTAVS